MGILLRCPLPDHCMEMLQVPVFNTVLHLYFQLWLDVDHGNPPAHWVTKWNSSEKQTNSKEGGDKRCCDQRQAQTRVLLPEYTRRLCRITTCKRKRIS